MSKLQRLEGIEIRTMVHGYKLNNYNATYEPKDFIFEETKRENDRVMKVIDVESGTEFWFSVPNKVETPRRNPKRN